MTKVDDILARVRELPPLPGTAVRLIHVLNDPSSTVEEIVELAQYDEAITTQMLKICNSAHFGLGHEISSLYEATRYLGTAKMLQVLMAVHGKSLMSKGQTGYGLDPGILWRHSVAVALASSILAKEIRLNNADLAFTAGLLHDIGKVVLNEYVGREFAEIVRILAEQKASFIEAEQQILGYSHEEIGGRLAEAWNLPEAITHCIRYHHNPGELTPPDPLVDVVYMANAMCLQLGIGLGADELNYRWDPCVLDRHNLGASDLEMIGAQTVVELKRVEQLFEDSLPAGQEKQSDDR